MSIIAETSTHPIFTSIPTYLETLSVVENDVEFLAQLDEYGIQTINRVNGVLNQVKIRLNSVDPYLLRKPVLDQLISDASQINTYIQSYNTYLTNHSYLNNINNYVDSLLSYLVAIPQLTHDSLDGLKDNVISFRRTVGQHKKVIEQQQEDLTEKTQEITTQIADLSNSYIQLKEKFDSTYSEFERKFTDLHNTFEETEELRTAQFEEQIKLLEETFDDKVTQFNEQWDQLLKKNEQVIQETVEKLELQQQSFLDETKQKQETYDSILNEHKKSVESLVGIISTNSISGHFKEVADKKEKLTSSWQKTTIFGFGITIAFGVYAFIFSDVLDWPSLVARFIVTTALGSFTAYAARQATKNELQEKSNRQMEVELKTLNPYIASFSEEDQIKLKEQLFPLIFGRADVDQSQERNTTTQANQINPQEVSNIATTAIEALKNLTSTNKGV